MFHDMDSIDQLSFLISFRDPFSPRETFKLSVAFPMGKSVWVEYFPLQTLTDFLLYIGSILNLMFELSFLGIFTNLAGKIKLKLRGKHK